MAANPNPKLGRGGKTAVDWEAAFAFYASLPAAERSYAAVAAEFGVSPRTVETHGRTGHWKQRLREIEAAAAQQANRDLAQARAEELRKIARLIEASFIAYAHKLSAGEVRMTPADLERLHRLQQQLSDELTSPRQQPNPQPATPVRPPEHTAAVLDALAESGALEALGLTRTPRRSPEEAPDSEGATS